MNETRWRCTSCHQLTTRKLRIRLKSRHMIVKQGRSTCCGAKVRMED